MSHYFTDDDSPIGRTREIPATIFGRDFSFTTTSGVFSGTRLDPGTAVLLRTVDPPERGHILDLGCGFGPIAVALAAASPGITVDAVDVSRRALEMTALNSQAAGVADRVQVGVPDDFPRTRYDEIWSNPPIRIGKQALHDMLLQWLPRLTDEGIAWLVVGKNLGADSLAKWLAGQGWPASREASAKGFRVLKVKRTAASAGGA